jgi:hypothetical protein
MSLSPPLPPSHVPFRNQLCISKGTFLALLWESLLKSWKREKNILFFERKYIA